MRCRYRWLLLFLLTLLVVSLFNPSLAFSLPIASPQDVVINEFLADPASGLSGDANDDGVRDASDDEFIELVNTTSMALDLSSFVITDSIATRHVFPAGTIIGPGQGIVVFGGGNPTGSFGGAQVYTASTGSLSLNNSGDTISLLDPNSTIIDTVNYSALASNDQSLTRSPDLTGPFVLHSQAQGSGGALFSPGTRIDGTPFASPVPEPSTLLLIGSGFIGLMGFKRWLVLAKFYEKRD